VFALRLLGFNLQRANLFPPAPKVDKDEDEDKEEEEEDEAAAKARKEKEKAAAAPPAWVDPDPEVYATALWDTDVLLRRVLSTAGIPAAAVKQAEASVTALFDTLYPTWRLKHTALDELLAFATSGSASTPPTPADVGRSRLLGVFMAALSSRSDIAVFLETSGAGIGDGGDSKPADDGDSGAGVEESKGGEGEGAEESKGGDDAEAAPSSSPATPATPGPKRAVKREKLTPFLADVERALVTLHLQSSISSKGLTVGSATEARQLLQLVSADIQAGILKFLGAVRTVSASGVQSAIALADALGSVADLGQLPFVGAAVKLLGSIQQHAVSAVTNPLQVTSACRPW